MFILIRALTYATIFSGFVLIAIPARVVVVGVAAAARAVRPVAGRGGDRLRRRGGAVDRLVLMFVTVGRGTPFPLDPPRQLVDRGPYAIIRNPMFAGAARWRWAVPPCTSGLGGCSATSGSS
jgi:protein-S-isoprenylcysteine O-methyltransferase Ste14